MKVKNTGSKIVNIGKTIILPGETAEVDDTYKANGAVQFLIKTERLEMDQQKAAKTTKAAKAIKQDAEAAASEAAAATV